MEVRKAIIERRSVRAYLSKPVSLDLIMKILESARFAPSGGNTQPWQVAVVTGQVKQRIQESMEARFRTGQRGQMEYPYYPQQWFSPYRERRRACGMQLYASLGIDKNDHARREDQWAANYRAFDAPVVLFFFMDKRLGLGSFIDIGTFIQSVMLSAMGVGLATCPQAALAEYPDIVKEALGYPDDLRLICGMALGYADESHPVNGYRTPRENVETFAKFFGFGDQR